MKELIVWSLHFPAGAVAILAAVAAFHFPKGSSKHIKAGQIFMVSMLVMLVSGGIAGALKGSLEDIFLTVLVSYAVFTAWLTVRHEPNDIGILEYFALAYIVLFGLAAVSINPEWAMVKTPGVFTFDAILALIFAVGDIRNILCKDMNPAHRLARHVWRVSFSIVWAALAFSDKIIKMLDSTIEQMPHVAAIPAILVMGVMFVWLFRIYKGKTALISQHYTG